jgi:hypothetical protein
MALHRGYHPGALRDLPGSPVDWGQRGNADFCPLKRSAHFNHQFLGFRSKKCVRLASMSAHARVSSRRGCAGCLLSQTYHLLRCRRSYAQLLQYASNTQCGFYVTELKKPLLILLDSGYLRAPPIARCHNETDQCFWRCCCTRRASQWIF